MAILRFVDHSGAYRPEFPSRDIDAAELAFMAKSRKIPESDIIEAAVGSGLFVVEGAPDASEVHAEGEQAASGLDGMSYGELQAAAKDLGLSQAGKKAEVLARIREKLAEADATTDATAASVARDTDATDSATDEETPEA